MIDYERLMGELRAARQDRGLSRREAAERSCVGEKSIISFETSLARVECIKLAQIERLAEVYGITIRELVERAWID